ncbi:MAG: hypothetical protein NTZ09_02690 [Candidatus Hydrogenedentes bacterium]|nr:hypothetical protein [Candidatus Hydrogenedentota bacterium]
MSSSRDRSSKGKKEIPKHPYGWFPGVCLSQELIESDAYKSLEHGEHDVLIDLLRIAGCANGEPFFFTWGQCKIQSAEGTFNKARERFCEIGFIDRRLDLKELKSGADLYTVSSRWRTFKRAPRESDSKKAKRIARFRDRRKKLLSKSKIAHPECGRGLHPDCGGTATSRGTGLHPDCVDIGQKRDHPEGVEIDLPLHGAVSLNAEDTEKHCQDRKRPEPGYEPPADKVAVLRKELAQFFDGLPKFPEMPFNRKVDLFTNRVARALGQDTKPVKEYLFSISKAGGAALSAVAEMIFELLEQGLPLSAIGRAESDHTAKGGAVDAKKAAAQ